VLAACDAGEERSARTSAAEPLPRVEATIPGVLAEQLADRADRVGEFEATCRARGQRARALLGAAESAIRTGRIPAALRRPLRDRVEAIARPRCLRQLRHADELAIWVRKRSAPAHRTPPDFRVARSSLDDDASDGLVWGVLEPMWYALETPYEPDPRLEQATPGQRAAYALVWTESEVSNGGFEQYFWNSTGMLHDDAIAGARLIDARDVERVLRDAAALFPDGRAPESRVARQEALDDLSPENKEQLGRLDDRFFSLLDDPARSSARFLEAYIRRHTDEFFLPS
jgi:Domain of unknown function (DUF4375)